MISASYVAGFLDGEGNISLCKRERRGGVEFEPTVRFTNTNSNVLEAIRKVFGGHISQRKAENAKWRSCCFLEYRTSDEILTVLQAVKPFLIVKKAQADHLIAYCLKHPSGKHTRYSSDDFEVWEALRKLNKKGPLDVAVTAG